MAVYWNGFLVRCRLGAEMWLQTSARNLEGLEYYRTLIDAPFPFRELPEYVGMGGRTSCSVLVLWPRRGGLRR